MLLFHNKKYKSVATLARANNITIATATKLLEELYPTRLLVNVMGDVQKIDLKTVTNPILKSEFNIQRLSAHNLLKHGGKVKNINIFKELPADVVVNLLVTVFFKFHISAPLETKTVLLPIRSSTDNLEETVINETHKYLNLISPSAELEGDIEIINYKSALTKQKLKFINGKLRSDVPISIESLYNEQIVKDNWIKYDTNNCVRDYLKHIHTSSKRMSKNTIDKLGNDDGVESEELYNHCKHNKINLKIFNINGDLELQYTPPKKSIYKAVIGIAYNNHFYPIKNKTLHKTKPLYDQVKVVTDIDNRLIKCLESNILPIDLCKSTIGDTTNPNYTLLSSFVHNKIQYIQNKSYDICNHILKIFGISDKIYPNITLGSIGNLISKLYLKESVDSFFPEYEKFIKGGFNYRTTKPFDIKNIQTIDKNKSYSHALMSLDYLIVCDYRTATITLNPKTITNDHYLYIAQPKESTILIPNTNMYSGSHLKRAYTEGIKFKLLEEITTTKTPNYYRHMIHDIYHKLDGIVDHKGDKVAKQICNIFIGKLEQVPLPNSNFTKISKICNEDEANRSSGFSYQIGDGDNYIVEVPEDINPTIYTKKLINVQIKDKAREIVYDKMLELKLTSDDIIQIKTDAITFKGIRKLTFNKDISGWNSEKYKPIKKQNTFDNPDLSFKLTKGTSNQLYNCYAGVGKTYKFINKLIPKYEDYIVLTPSHASLMEYRHLNLNCSVIQTYSMSNRIPTESVIFIDEIGMCDREANDIIYKCHLLGKTIISAGDYKQLPPVTDNTTLKVKYNNPYYLDHLYGKTIQLTKNRRNDFTIEYYDSILNKTVAIDKEVLKHSIDYKDADTIICYLNSTVAKYNNLKLLHLGYKSKHTITNKKHKLNIIGSVLNMRVKCKSNLLSKYNIYNNFTLTITDELEDNMFKLSDGSVITIKQLEAFFIPAYAMTAYGVQGRSLSSYHFPVEDIRYITKSENGANLAYVIISRLKTK